MASLLIIFAVFLAFGWAEERVATIQPCFGSSYPICSVTEVRINPCESDKYCSLRKGENASMSFDFTPNFSASKLFLGIDWVTSLGNYFGIALNNGCAFTTCPIQASRPQTLIYSGKISESYPRGTYNMRCQLWNEEELSQMCCFQTTIRIKGFLDT